MPEARIDRDDAGLFSSQAMLMFSLSESLLPKALVKVVKVVLEAVAGLTWRISCFHNASPGFDRTRSRINNTAERQARDLALLVLGTHRQEAGPGHGPDADAVA